jgi:IclR family KDG regulon transcriptional repressor
MKTVKTAFSVLREISSGEFSLTELANRMGMDKASMHRYLRTLTAEGFVEQNPGTRIYKLGLAVIELSGLRLAQMDVVSIASPHLKQLGQATQETVQLSILNDQHLLFLHIIESTHSLRFSNRLGDRMPPYYSAAGKLLLAYEPESELMDYFSSKIEPLTAREDTQATGNYPKKGLVL